MTECEASPRRAVRTMRLAAVAGALVAALLGTPAMAAGPPPRPLYLALGDSVAAGVGAQPPATEGYVPELHDLLAAEVPCGDGQALGCRLDLLNIAEPGATTTTLLDRPTPQGRQPHHAAPSHRHPDRRRPTDHAGHRRQRRLRSDHPGLQQRPAGARVLVGRFAQVEFGQDVADVGLRRRVPWEVCSIAVTVCRICSWDSAAFPCGVTSRARPSVVSGVSMTTPRAVEATCSRTESSTSTTSSTPSTGIGADTQHRPVPPDDDGG